jgi:hypothetical protein
MKCPICGADATASTSVCASCGSNLKTRGGADIVVKKDGTVDHAGDSRWRGGAGMAGAGGLAAIFKTGLIFKVWSLFYLFRLAAFGGATGIVVAVLLGAGLVTFSIFRHRHRQATWHP